MPDDAAVLEDTAVDTLLGMTETEWRAIERAALLSLQGRHDEAEATRFAAGYHNL